MNEPPDHTVELSAANLLSPGGMTVAKCSRTISGYSRTAVSMSVNKTPCLPRSIPLTAMRPRLRYRVAVSGSGTPRGTGGSGDFHYVDSNNPGAIRTIPPSIPLDSQPPPPGQGSAAAPVAAVWRAGAVVVG